MFCQKCRSPLKFDSSLDELDPASWNFLIDASSGSLQGEQGRNSNSTLIYTREERTRYMEAARSALYPLDKDFDRKTLSSKVHRKASSSQDNSSMSFVLLPNSQQSHRASIKSIVDKKPNASARHKVLYRANIPGDDLLAERMEKNARIFEILSSNSDVDHPVCVECTEIIMSEMEKRLATVSKERDAYADYLKTTRANEPTKEEQNQEEKELESIRTHETIKFQELELLESEKLVLESELAQLEFEARRLDREEEDFCRQRNELTQLLSYHQQERDSLNLRHKHDSHQLDLLQRTNVYNDAFNIAYDKDGFGTINGLRLGRNSTKNVDWAEVNAAWGQAILLLVVVAEQLKYSFIDYILNPMGSTSTIDKLEAETSSSDTNRRTATLPLFYSSDLPLSIGFLHRHFDMAMIAFLDCVRQLGFHIDKTVSSAERVKRMPYEIKKDKIGDVSIKLGSFNGDENWTTACKRTLLSCKFLLAHASHLEVTNNVNAS